jgi:DNA-binding transcriptional LysR family regulator
MALNVFSGVIPFVHVAEAGSFRAAAARLGVSVPAVSKAVAKLEAELGVLLLDRTSRHVALTTEGQSFFERCREAVTQVQAAREQVASAQRGPHGTLRVTFPPVLARTLLPVFDALLRRHPRLSLDLMATNRFSKLTREELDVAIRMGPLEDSSLIARTLRRPRWVTVAAPAYLAKRGVPASLADLAQHECLKFSLDGKTVEWQFEERGNPIAVRSAGCIRSDLGDMLVDAAVRGMGIAQVFDFMARPLLETRQLVEVLAPHAIDGPPLHALTSARRASIPRVRVLLDALVQSFGAAGPSIGGR